MTRLTRRAILAGLALAASLSVVAQAANQTVRTGIMSAEDEGVWAVVKRDRHLLTVVRLGP